jgi:tRNA threonylcarbamoyladenosine biosynthesis protein TsaE
MTGPYTRALQSSDETERLGESLAPLVHVGDLIVLTGPLGAGKTRFVAGLARGLGVAARVRSPTFTLVGEYHGRLLLAHVDLYRLAAPVDPAPLGLDEYRERAAIAIEWGERLPERWLEDAVLVTFTITGESARAATIRGMGERGSALCDAWCASGAMR